ncbi:ABC transporter substrate-binding protein [Pseudonocardia sp.]|uniref:ABC transporter substrate-binding protein n=1 Tax=Pseudonocardia sp. TaxID=60912 RepID=UPI002607AEB3|nr:ABC transporter substrate-binding protein [Pseudonocardia sp.]
MTTMLLDPVSAATRRQLLVGTGLLATLAACGAAPPPAPPAAQTGTAEGDFGPVELPTDPQRVVAGYDTDTDVALVLGLTLVGAPGARGSATLPFPEYQPADRLTDVERIATFLPEPNFEAIAALAPDAILDGAFGVQERYDTLRSIAPTLSYSTANYTNWRDGLLLAGQAFGRVTQATDFIAAYEERAAELRARVEQRFPNRSAAVFYSEEAGGLVADTSANQTLAAMVDCGFVLDPAIVSSDDVGKSFSQENFGDLAALDVIVLSIDINFEAGETTIERTTRIYDAAKASPLWAGLPAVAAGRVFDAPAEIGFPSPLTATASLDFVENTLLA